MDVACHVISEVLMEQRQLELQMVGAARDLDVAADVSVKDSAGIGIVHKGFQIFLLQEKACGSAVIDVKSGQGNEIRLGRDELDKGTASEVGLCLILLSIKQI